MAIPPPDPDAMYFNSTILIIIYYVFDRLDEELYHLDAAAPLTVIMDKCLNLWINAANVSRIAELTLTGKRCVSRVLSRYLEFRLKVPIKMHNKDFISHDELIKMRPDIFALVSSSSLLPPEVASALEDVHIKKKELNYGNDPTLNSKDIFLVSSALLDSIARNLKNLILLGPMDVDLASNFLNLMKNMAAFTDDALEAFLYINPEWFRDFVGLSLTYITTETEEEKDPLIEELMQGSHTNVGGYKCHISVYYLKAIANAFQRDIKFWIHSHLVDPALIVTLIMLHQISEEEEARSLGLKLADIVSKCPETEDVYGYGAGIGIDPGYLFRLVSHRSPFFYIREAIRYSEALASQNRYNSMLPELLRQVIFLLPKLTLKSKDLLLKLLAPWVARFSVLVHETAQGIRVLGGDRSAPNAYADAYILCKEMLSALIIITQLCFSHIELSDSITKVWQSVINKHDYPDFTPGLVVEILLYLFELGLPGVQKAIVEANERRREDLDAKLMFNKRFLKKYALGEEAELPSGSTLRELSDVKFEVDPEDSVASHEFRSLIKVVFIHLARSSGAAWLIDDLMRKFRRYAHSVPSDSGEAFLTYEKDIKFTQEPRTLSETGAFEIVINLLAENGALFVHHVPSLFHNAVVIFHDHERFLDLLSYIALVIDIDPSRGKETLTPDQLISETISKTPEIGSQWGIIALRWFLNSKDADIRLRSLECFIKLQVSHHKLHSAPVLSPLLMQLYTCIKLKDWKTLGKLCEAIFCCLQNDAFNRISYQAALYQGFALLCNKKPEVYEDGLQITKYLLSIAKKESNLGRSARRWIYTLNKINVNNSMDADVCRLFIAGMSAEPMVEEVISIMQLLSNIFSYQNSPLTVNNSYVFFEYLMNIVLILQYLEDSEFSKTNLSATELKHIVHSRLYLRIKGCIDIKNNLLKYKSNERVSLEQAHVIDTVSKLWNDLAKLLSENIDIEAPPSIVGIDDTEAKLVRQAWEDLKPILIKFRELKVKKDYDDIAETNLFNFDAKIERKSDLQKKLDIMKVLMSHVSELFIDTYIEIDENDDEQQAKERALKESNDRFNAGISWIHSMLAHGHKSWTKAILSTLGMYLQSACNYKCSEKTISTFSDILVKHCYSNDGDIIKLARIVALLMVNNSNTDTNISNEKLFNFVRSDISSIQKEIEINIAEKRKFIRSKMQIVGDSIDSTMVDKELNQSYAKCLRFMKACSFRIIEKAIDSHDETFKDLINKIGSNAAPIIIDKVKSEDNQETDEDSETEDEADIPDDNEHFEFSFNESDAEVDDKSSADKDENIKQRKNSVVEVIMDDDIDNDINLGFSDVSSSNESTDDTESSSSEIDASESENETTDSNDIISDGNISISANDSENQSEDEDSIESIENDNNDSDNSGSNSDSDSHEASSDDDDSSNNNVKDDTFEFDDSTFKNFIKKSKLATNSKINQRRGSMPVQSSLSSLSVKKTNRSNSMAPSSFNRINRRKSIDDNITPDRSNKINNRRASTSVIDRTQRNTRMMNRRGSMTMIREQRRSSISNNYDGGKRLSFVSPNNSSRSARRASMSTLAHQAKRRASLSGNNDFERRRGSISGQVTNVQNFNNRRGSMSKPIQQRRSSRTNIDQRNKSLTLKPNRRGSISKTIQQRRGLMNNEQKMKDMELNRRFSQSFSKSNNYDLMKNRKSSMQIYNTSSTRNNNYINSNRRASLPNRSINRRSSLISRLKDIDLKKDQTSISNKLKKFRKKKTNSSSSSSSSNDDDSSSDTSSEETEESESSESETESSDSNSSSSN